jgi:adenylate kinase family enzyme
MYIDLLKPVIFAGHESGRDKFLLVGFPETIEQVEAFEANCTRISGIILATDEGENVDIKNNEPSLCNIDT